MQPEGLQGLTADMTSEIMQPFKDVIYALFKIHWFAYSCVTEGISFIIRLWSVTITSQYFVNFSEYFVNFSEAVYNTCEVF